MLVIVTTKQEPAGAVKVFVKFLDLVQCHSLGIGNGFVDSAGVQRMAFRINVENPAQFGACNKCRLSLLAFDLSQSFQLKLIKFSLRKYGFVQNLADQPQDRGQILPCRFDRNTGTRRSAKNSHLRFEFVEFILNLLACVCFAVPRCKS